MTSNPHTPTPTAPRDPAELAAHLETAVPTIPDELTQYIMATNGISTDDLGLTRLVSFAAQRFASQIIYDSQQFAKKRALEEGGGRREDGGGGGTGTGVGRDKALTTEDLGTALRDYGVNHKLPPYFLDRSAPPEGRGEHGVPRSDVAS